MSAPLICCICLSYKKKEFEERARRSFWNQKEKNADLFVMDTAGDSRTVGALRNHCNALVPKETKYIAHWDYDDWSAPDRLSIQLAHIQKCGKLAVGFRDMTMYETKTDKVYFYQNPHPHYTLGTSLFYKREAWEKMKFPDKTPEDPQWRRQLGFDNFEGMSSLRADGTPIMIQVIHGGNASARIIRGGTYFKEASESQAKAVREILANA